MTRWTNRPDGSNWGDFGDDEIGRMNLLNPERRFAAVREVREGIVFTLSLPTASVAARPWLQRQWTDRSPMLSA